MSCRRRKEGVPNLFAAQIAFAHLPFGISLFALLLLDFVGRLPGSARRATSALCATLYLVHATAPAYALATTPPAPPR